MHTQFGFRFIIKLIAVFISVIALLNSSSQANAQGSATDLELKAEAGFGGYAKEGKWIPVHITVENKGADINEASLQVSYKDFSGVASVFGADISLPTNSRKELFIYVYYPQSGAASLNVELIADKKVISKTSARISNIAPQSLVIGLMTKTPSDYSGLSQITPQSGITRLVEIQPATLPDKAQGWETLDVIVISDVDTGTLTSAQLNALELWIAKGGILFTVGGPNWQSTVQGIQDLLPIQVTGTTHVSGLPDIDSFSSLLNFAGDDLFNEETGTLLATGNLTKNAHVLATQGNQPLVIEKTLGKGKSIFFATDPGLEPYKSWSGLYTIYDSLFNFKHPQSAWVNGKWDIYSTNEALSTIAELAVPSILLICGLLVFYIGLIGPVNYIFLRVIKKREWAWITIPAIVVVVTTVSYIYGYLYRGTTPSLNRLTVIQAWDGVSQAQSDTLVGVYSPQRDTYILEAENGALLFPYNSEDINLKSNTAWFSNQIGQNVAVPEIPIEIGGMKVIGATGATTPLALEHDLTIRFDNGIASISGTITNNSDVNITDLNLVTPARWIRIGDLVAGESQDVNMLLTTTLNSPEFFYDGSTVILQIQAFNPQIQLDKETHRKDAFLRSILTAEYGENNSNWGIYLMGWPAEAQPSAILKDIETKNTDTIFYIHQVSPAVSTSNEAFTLTTALFEWQSSTDEATPYYAYSYSNSEYTMRFHPAIPIKFSGVQKLNLNLDSYLPVSDVQVRLWNFTINDWDIIGNVNWGNYSVPNPEQYVNGAGEVILNIKGSQNQSYIEMKKSTISLTVTP